MTTLSKEKKREIRKKAREASTGIPIEFSLVINIIILIAITMRSQELDNFLIFGIGFMAISPLVGFIVDYITNYVKLKKEEEERIKRANNLDGCFYNGDIWVTPKYHKEYLDFFENLSDFYEIKYYASFIKEEETIKIFIIINGEEAIEFEKIEKAEFLDFYQINKAKL